MPHPDFLPPLSSSQLGEAMGFLREFPYGPERDDRRAGSVISVIANLFKRRGDTPVHWHDVFPEHAPPPQDPRLPRNHAALWKKLQTQWKTALEKGTR